MILEHSDLKEQPKLFENLLKAYPENSQAHYNVGRALHGQGRLEEAAAEYQKALAIREDLAARCNLGAVLVTLGRLEAAIDEYRRAVSVEPGDATARNNLGVALRKAGRFKEAEGEFRKAVRLDPRYTTAQENLAHCQREQMQQGLEKQEAQEILEFQRARGGGNQPQPLK